MELITGPLVWFEEYEEDGWRCGHFRSPIVRLDNAIKRFAAASKEDAAYLFVCLNNTVIQQFVHLSDAAVCKIGAAIENSNLPFSLYESADTAADPQAVAALAEASGAPYVFDGGSSNSGWGRGPTGEA